VVFHAPAWHVGKNTTKHQEVDMLQIFRVIFTAFKIKIHKLLSKIIKRVGHVRKGKNNANKGTPGTS
jgi:hypothetical protein